MTKTAPVITIDGPSNAGKSTLCKAIAKILKWNSLNSGTIYRILALVALENRIDLTSEKSLVSLATNLDIRFISVNRNVATVSKSQDISNKIRTQNVSNVASKIAAFPCVRKVLLNRQRAFCKDPGLIADGRDMGTAIFPDAPVKIFLDASLEERANRRMLQLNKSGLSVNFEHLLLEIKERDDRDRNRTIAPLFPAEDALILNSTFLSIDQVIKKSLEYIYQKLALQITRPALQKFRRIDDIYK